MRVPMVITALNVLQTLQDLSLVLQMLIVLLVMLLVVANACMVKVTFVKLVVLALWCMKMGTVHNVQQLVIAIIVLLGYAIIVLMDG